MKTDLSKYLEWKYFDRILKIIEVSAVLLASIFTYLTVKQIPVQIKEWQNSQDSRAMSLLLKMDDKLQQGIDYKISLAINKNNPLLIKNHGKFTEDDLDVYLGDLSSVSDMYQKKLISMDDLYKWFSDYIIKSYENKEIQEYLGKIRTEDESYFKDIDTAYKDIKKY